MQHCGWPQHKSSKQSSLDLLAVLECLGKRGLLLGTCFRFHLSTRSTRKTKTSRIHHDSILDRPQIHDTNGVAACQWPNIHAVTYMSYCQHGPTFRYITIMSDISNMPQTRIRTKIGAYNERLNSKHHYYILYIYIHTYLLRPPRRHHLYLFTYAYISVFTSYIYTYKADIHTFIHIYIHINRWKNRCIYHICAYTDVYIIQVRIYI